MDYQKQAPADLQGRLASLTEVSDQVPHVRLAWEPGRPWVTEELSGIYGSPSTTILRTDHRVERWMVYEMIPIGQVSEELKEQLDGPSPNALIRYSEDLKVIYAPEDYAITQTQWALYHETGRRFFPNPFWCVQGDGCGHKLQYNTLEKKLRKLRGLDGEPPTPGDLPYAEPDWRLVDQLARYLRLKLVEREFQALRENNPEEYKRIRRDREEDYRREVLKLVADDGVGKDTAREVTDVLMSDKLMHGTKAVEVPRDRVDWDRVWERAEEQYITTGRVARNPHLI